MIDTIEKQQRELLRIKPPEEKILTIIRNDSEFECQHPDCTKRIKARRKYCDAHLHSARVIGGRKGGRKTQRRRKEQNIIPKQKKQMSSVLIFSEDFSRINQFKPFNLALKDHKETIHKLITYAEKKGKLTPKLAIKKEVFTIHVYSKDVKRLDHFKKVSGSKSRQELIFKLLDFAEKEWKPIPILNTEKGTKKLSIYSDDIPRLRKLKQIYGYKSNKELIHELLRLIKLYEFYTLLE